MSGSIAVLQIGLDRSYLKFVSGLLESGKHPIQVDCCVNPNEAQDAISKKDYDCFVISHSEGEFDGFSFRQSISDAVSGVPAILHPDMTHMDSQLINRALGSGFEHVVFKEPGSHPIDILADKIVSSVSCSCDRYKEAVEAVNDPMYILDSTGCVMAVNSAMADLLEVDKSSLIGSQVSELLSDDCYESATDLMNEVLEDPSQEYATIDLDLETFSGPFQPCEVSITPIVEDGTHIGTTGIVRNISDRRDHSDRLSALHHTMRRLIDSSTTHEAVSKSLKSAEDLFDIELAVFFAPDSKDDISAFVPTVETDQSRDLIGPAPTMKSDSLVWDVYHSGETRYAPDLWEEDQIHNEDTVLRSELLIPIGDFGVIGFASTTPDYLTEADRDLANILKSNLTEVLVSIQSQRRIEKREQQLKRENERLDEFASIITHDLRNPLNVAKGRLDLAVKEIEEPPSHLKQVGSSIDRMGAIVDETLTLAREGKTVGETHAVSLHEVAIESCRNVKLDRSQLTVETDDATFYADETKLYHIFENLYRNTLEHNQDDDQTELSVTVGTLSNSDGFYIEDDGCGIPENRRDDVFSVGHTTNRNGTGLGLAITHRIVEAHDWEISAAESQSGGARFEIRGVEFDRESEPTSADEVLWPPQVS